MFVSLEAPLVLLELSLFANYFYVKHALHLFCH